MKKLNYRPAFRSFWPWWLLFFACFGIVPELRVMFPDLVWDIPDIIGDGMGDIPVSMFVVVPVIVLLKIFWLRFDTKYTLGPAGIIVTTGILGVRRRSAMAEYGKIAGASADQSVIGQLLNYGNIKMGTAETGESELLFRGIAKPLDFVVLIKERIAQARSGGAPAPVRQTAQE